MLTNKAKLDFETEHGSIDHLTKKEQIIRLIDWFDEKGFIIFLDRRTESHRDWEFDSWYITVTNKKGIHLNNYLIDVIYIDDRWLANETGVEVANLLYNNEYFEDERKLLRKGQKRF